MRFYSFPLSALLVVFLLGCEKDSGIKGLWDMKLVAQEKQIPFQLNFKNNEEVLLLNGAETIKLKVARQNGKVLLPILNFDSFLELELKDDKLKGYWKRPNKKPPYEEPVFGERSEKKMKLPNLELPAKWKMELKEKDKSNVALLIFTQTKNGEFASVLTPTGDYRYLAPELKKDKLILSGFDGVFAFYFEGEIKNNIYIGTMYAGRSWNQPFTARPDPDFELPDPTKTTTFSGDLTKLVLPRLHGPPEPVINARNKNKVKVIQIFGSWCPNCIDETRFINLWRKQNPDKEVSFSMISFERSPNKKHALKSLRKAQELYGIDYPIYIGGFTPNDKVSKVLPKLENFISFPTTLILDQDNKVRKIHAGFSGPATGKYYEKFVLDFDKMIEKLLAE